VDGGDLVHARMYRGLADVWQGWLKSAVLGNRGGWLSVLLELLALPVFTIFPFLLPLLTVFLNGKHHNSMKYTSIYAATLIELASLLTFRLWLNNRLDIKWYYIFTHHIAGALFEGLLVQSSWHVIFNKGFVWRNRRYYTGK
jgi:chlorobactene glucosyltransferase